MLAVVVFAEEEHDMTGRFLERIEGKDWDAVQDARSAGAGAAQRLAELAASDDAELRELALYCLNELGGPIAEGVFVRALGDPREDVRDRAVQFLQTHHAAVDVQTLLAQLDGNSDAFARERLALVVGRIGDPRSIPTLERMLERSEPPEVQHAMYLALARLGQSESRARVLERLEAPDVATRLSAIEDFEYLGDRNETHRLLPLLDDTRDAMNVGLSGQTNLLRVCDLAVDLLLVVLDQPDAIPPPRQRRYDDSELARARELARGSH